MPREISKFDDIIDSRDVIKRIEEIEEYETSYNDAKAEHDEAIEARKVAADAAEELRLEFIQMLDKHGYGSQEANAAEEQLGLANEKLTEAEDAVGDYAEALRDAENDFTEDLQEELIKLRALAEQGEGYGDWSHGETLIADRYFPTYAEEVAYDIGAISRTANWPLNCIDWEQASRELKTDYTSIDFDGETFWMRS